MFVAASFAYCFLFSFNLIHIAFYVRAHIHAFLTHTHTRIRKKKTKCSSKAITDILRWVEFHMMLLRYCSAIEINSSGRDSDCDSVSSRGSGIGRESYTTSSQLQSGRIHLFYTYIYSFLFVLLLSLSLFFCDTVCVCRLLVSERFASVCYTIKLLL